MENKNIPYFAYEASQARNERTVKRLIIALIVATILIFASNLVWAYIFTQYDYVESEEDLRVHISTEGGEDANYIGHDGDLINGENNSIQKTGNESENP